MQIALAFPGQGSQTVGMMAPYESLPAVRRTFDEASAVLGQDLWELTAKGPAEALNQTVNTQPVMLTAGYALYRAWVEAGGVTPAVLAGHSLGEYTALVAAGVMAFQDALPLVLFRAQAMQEAVPEGVGAIAAVLGLEDEAIAAVCTAAAQGQVLEPANFNAPGQVVIAGHREAVARGMELAKVRGAKRALLLPMSAPSHCSLMRAAAEQLAQRLALTTLKAPEVPVINNVDVCAAHDQAAIRDSLVRQLSHSVRWVETVRAIAQRGASRIIECGPGSVLTALNKRIAPGMEALAIKDADALLELASAT
jgi:[acyl-carrier-protein] S-malonyltransferase